VKRALGWIAGIGGIIIATFAMRPSPAASVSGHARVLLLTLMRIRSSRGLRGYCSSEAVEGADSGCSNERHGQRIRDQALFGIGLVLFAFFVFAAKE